MIHLKQQSTSSIGILYLFGWLFCFRCWGALAVAKNAGHNDKQLNICPYVRLLFVFIVLRNDSIFGEADSVTLAGPCISEKIDRRRNCGEGAPAARIERSCERADVVDKFRVSGAKKIKFWTKRGGRKDKRTRLLGQFKESPPKSARWRSWGRYGWCSRRPLWRWERRILPCLPWGSAFSNRNEKHENTRVQN